MTEQEFKLIREKMVEAQIINRGVCDERVLNAFFKVPRHLFVNEEQQMSAYGDFPLSIGEGQTISQPYVVALMTESLNLPPQARVLEIGTGSGYQTAILAELAESVFSIEVIERLQLKARQVISDLGYTNVSFKIGDGKNGWPEHAPFDGILIAAGARDVPKPLLEQLAEDGTMVVPVGSWSSQDLLVITKEEGGYQEKSLGGCRFVPLV